MIKISRALIVNITFIILFDGVIVYAVTFVGCAPEDDLHRREHVYGFAVAEYADGEFAPVDVFFNEHITTVKRGVTF
ncbi:hypothetical protein SDC9_177302 [bioreactor metagenome]|uniref:Uncharacterized protein n=1 Tax=bioreactor metagenome TaxID=1076179 RepID=A0A645GVR6_9ZZZZ